MDYGGHELAAGAEIAVCGDDVETFEFAGFWGYRGEGAEGCAAYDLFS